MQFSFTIPDAQVPRVRAWIAAKYPPVNSATEQPYTNAEYLALFKEHIREWVKSEVQQHELLEQHEQVFQNYVRLDVDDA